MCFVQKHANFTLAEELLSCGWFGVGWGGGSGPSSVVLVSCHVPKSTPILMQAIPIKLVGLESNNKINRI